MEADAYDERVGSGCGCSLLRGGLRTLTIGFALGMIVAVGAAWVVMPALMLNVGSSRLTFDETVAAIQQAAAEQGWVVAGTRDLQRSLAKHGRPFGRRVKVIELCHSDYAHRVLTDRRELSALMPCSIAVYEGDDGAVHVSRMNSGLMGRMFGGSVAEIMGKHVATDVEAILAKVLN